MPARVAQGFNPTVVRFEHVHLARRTAEDARFNPTVVRFEPLPPPTSPSPPCCFNPTVVRFEPLPDVSRAPIPPTVSIPQWCDLNPIISIPRLGKTQVSIPQWCDLN